MSDENIVVSVTDRVPTTIATKLQQISQQAGAANTAVLTLQASLNSLNAASLRNAMSGGTSGANTLSTAIGSLNGMLNTLTSAISSTNAVMGSLATNAAALNGSVQGVGTNIQALTTAVQGMGSGASNAGHSVTGLAAAFDIWAIAAEKVFGYMEKVGETVTTIVEWRAQADRMRIGLDSVSGSAEAAAANQAYLTQTIDKLGLETKSATDGFIKFAASTKNTALQGEQTQQIFTAVSEAASVLHLSAQSTSDTFLALSQMASKGVVSMEELRRQLSDHIPGAMNLAASAMGVTVQQLDKMISSGQVLADDFLPKFAQALHDNYAGALEESSDSAQASLNRFANAWTNLEQTIGKSAIGDAAKGQLNIITDAVNGMTEAIGRAKAAGSGFWGQAAAAGGSVLSFLNPVNAFDYHAQSNDGLKTQIDQLTKARDETKDWYKWNQLNYDIQQAQAKLAANQAANPAASTSIPGMSAADKQRALNKQGQTTVDAFLNGTGTGQSQFLTQTEKQTQDLAKLKTQFDAVQKGYNAGTVSLADYNKALDAYNSRVDAINAKFAKPGLTAAHKAFENSLNQQLTELDGQAQQTKQIYDQGVANLQVALNQQKIDQTEYLTNVSDLKNQELVKLRDIAIQEATLAAGKDQLSVRQKYLNQVADYNAQLVTNETQTAAKIQEVMNQSAIAAQKVADAFALQGVKRNTANAGALNTTGQTQQQISDQKQLTDIMNAAETARQAILVEATKNGTQYTKGVTDNIARVNQAEQSQLADEQNYFAQRNQLQQSFAYGFESAANQIIESSQNVATQIASTMTQGFDSAAQALAEFATTGKLNFTSLVTSMLQDLIKLELKFAASQVLQSLFGASDFSGVFGFGTSGSSTSAMTSSASSGVVGSLEGSTSGLFGLGFAGGGYTGDGDANTVAGPVHRGEYVFTKAETSAIGVGTLKAIASGAKGYANGGYVGAGVSSSAMASSGSVVFAPNINITNSAANVVGVSASTSTDAQGKPQIDLLVTQLENQMAGNISKGRGAMHNAIQNKFGARSIPGR